MPTFTLRSSVEVSERLARRAVCNIEGYWPATAYTDEVISLAPSNTWNVPGSFSVIIIDCDAGLSLFLGWTQNLGTIELPINQNMTISSPLSSAYIRNAAGIGTPNANVRVITLS
jgi:hypothetical protein